MLCNYFLRDCGERIQKNTAQTLHFPPLFWNTKYSQIQPSSFKLQFYQIILSLCWEGIGEERREKINSFPCICLFIHLRHQEEAGSKAARSTGSDTFIYGACRERRGTLIFWQQKFWLLINISDIKSVSNYEPI